MNLRQTKVAEVLCPSTKISKMTVTIIRITVQSSANTCDRNTKIHFTMIVGPIRVPHTLINTPMKTDSFTLYFENIHKPRGQKDLTMVRMLMSSF